MSISRPSRLGQNYAFVVLGVIFLALLAAAGQRSAPGVLILPLESAFGWGRDTISLTAALGILLYGLMGPFAAALFESFGLKRTLLCALAVMAVSTAASSFMTESWHFLVTWGVFSGLGSGCVAIVLGATVTGRWFATNRGLVMGILTASTATGTLIFLPALASIAEHFGWRPVVLTVAGASAFLIPVVALLLPERPQDRGMIPYGANPAHPPPVPPRRTGLLTLTFGTLKRAASQKAFWYLFATFYICGFTTNGLVGTHLVAMCGDFGIAETAAAGLLATMGLFDLLGTTGSGWLTDRFDSRKLLFCYYGLRGLALIYLPFCGFDFTALGIFAVVFGLDWIATVPPTLRLTAQAFGERDAPIVFGWIAAGHQIGAASAAYFAGYMRAEQGSYVDAFVIAGMTGVLAAFLSLMINRDKRVATVAA